MTLFSTFLVTVLTSIGLGSPSQDNDRTLTAIVAASGGEFDNNSRDYDMLLQAVLAVPGIAEALDNCDDSLTLFAPNDAAFIRLAQDLGYQGSDEAGAFGAIVAALTQLGNGDFVPVLREVLTYHVAPRELGPFRVLFSRRIETLQGGVIRPFFFILRDNDPDLRDPRLTFPINVRACNGRLHSINRVLIPLDI